MLEPPHALIREEIRERDIESHAPYLKVFGGLAILTLIEYLYAHVFKDYFAILVLGLLFWAVVKAALVGWFFMHLKFEGKWVYLLLIPAGILAAILVLALVPDVALNPGTDENSIPNDAGHYSLGTSKFQIAAIDRVSDRSPIGHGS